MRTARSSERAADPKTMFGAQAASVAGKTPPAPSAPQTLSVTQYTIANPIPTPMPYSVLRGPAKTANGIASAVMMTVTKGKATFRWSATMYGTAYAPPARSWSM